MRRFFKWKSSTASLIRSYPLGSDGTDVVFRDRDIDALVNSMLDPLHPFFSPTQAPKYHGAYEAELEQIIQLAIHIDAEMSEQWAWYVVESDVLEREGTRFGYLYNEKTMNNVREDIITGENWMVGLVISPRLLRCGTQDADRYHEVKVVEKQKVIGRVRQHSKRKRY